MKSTGPDSEINNEKLEGISPAEDATWGDYPIDTLLIRNEMRTVYDIVRRIEKGSFIMNPDFQREFIWPRDKQSKLIESVIMRIPLPVFYLAEDDEGRMIVVDGLQRLSTFRDFLDNKLTLDLKDRKELHGKKFEKLSPKLQNRVEDCNLVLYVIDAKVPDRARLDIFERVNGGMTLTRQQMRNCLYNGKATRFLKKEATSKLFLKATGGSLRASTMRDREFVNRFCAFRINPESEYRGDMDDFLAKALKKMNKMTEEELERLSSTFRNSLRNNYMAFNKHAFRKHTSSSQSRSVINASLWDVMTNGLCEYSEGIIEANIRNLQSGFYQLMEDEGFIASVTYGVNDMKRVRTRFKRSREVFGEIFG